MTLKHLARETLDLVAAGEYETDGRRVRFTEQQELAVRGTRLYRREDIESLPATPADENQTIRVLDGTTQVVAQTLARGNTRRENSRQIEDFDSFERILADGLAQRPCRLLALPMARPARARAETVIPLASPLTPRLG